MTHGLLLGAVLSQLPQEASVTSNVAPKHYGVCGGNIYDASRDEGQSKYLDEYEDVWRCHVMTWYIKKGDDLLRSRKITFPFYQKFKPNPSKSELLVESELLECSIDREPVHPKDGVTSRNCNLKADLSSVPKEVFKRKKLGATGEYWELHYNLLVSVESGPMIFSLEIGGKQYGQVSADY